MSPAQLPLDFDPRPALGGEDFLVAPNNADAVAWLDRWPDWPAVVLAIHGPDGCGKTHLTQVFLASSGAAAVDADTLAGTPAPQVFGDAPAVVIDGADTMLTGGLETPLFHLYNVAAETGRKILMTARSAPARWEISLPDLRSRLSTAITAEIGLPDDPLIAALIVKLFADRQLRVEDGVVNFLLPRLERSFAAVLKAVAAIDEAALAEQRRITVPLARRVLQEIQPEE